MTQHSEEVEAVDMGTLVLDTMCKHLIGIGWYEGRVNSQDEFISKPQFCGASAFLARFDNDSTSPVFLVTAGHVIGDCRVRTSDPGHVARNVSLLDVWGPRSECDLRIPFDIFGTPSVWVDDRANGRDFAIIQIPDIVARSLKQTTTPFGPTNWSSLAEVHFDFYAMLGLPDCEKRQMKRPENGGELITTYQSPVLLVLEHCDATPYVDPAAGPQLVAQIKDVTLANISGMSGGPIFGFRRTPEGRLAYWPVAIQSRWFPESRVVVGTLIHKIATELELEAEALAMSASHESGP